MNNNELYHHGILGMKWGVRRTPEQLGYKTSSNRRRTKTVREKKAEARAAIKKAKLKAKTDLKLADIRRKNQEKIDRAAAKDFAKKQEQLAKQQSKLDKKNYKIQAKEQSKIDKKNRKIKAKELSKIEKQQKKSLAKRFVQSAFNDVIKPAAISAGKDLATEYMNKIGIEKLGLKKQLSEYERVAAEAKKLKNLKDIAGYKDFFKERSDKMKEEAISAETERKKKAKETAYKQANYKANRQNPYKDQVRFNEQFTDEYGRGPASNYNTSSDTYSKVYRNQNGLSKVESNGKTWDSKYNQYAYEVPFTDIPNEYSSSGEKFVRRLLDGRSHANKYNTSSDTYSKVYSNKNSYDAANMYTTSYDKYSKYNTSSDTHSKVYSDQNEFEVPFYRYV